MKTYCINLDLRPDKWETALNHFQDHEIEVERVSGIKEQKEFYKYPTSRLVHPIRGCVSMSRDRAARAFR